MLAMDRHEDDRAEKLLASGAPDDPTLARIRGRLALARHDGPTAVHYFRIAQTDEPENRDTLFGLINALSISGDEKGAAPLREMGKNLEILNTLVQKAASPRSRDEPGLFSELGAACAALGHVAEARAWYELAIARDPLDTRSQQALFRLQAIDKPDLSASTPRGDPSGP
jgi:Flp pilus assembly protein TadD